MKKGKKKMIIKILCVIIFLGVIGTLTVVGINLYVTGSVKSRIVTVEKCKNLDADCIIVLGAGIRKDGSPTWILEDRIIVGDQLYKNGAASKIIMSGDHGRASHDEVNTMKDYAINENVPSEDIFMDHAGFSTYETVYRAKEIFEADKVIIVTQEYTEPKIFLEQKKLL